MLLAIQPRKLHSEGGDQSHPWNLGRMAVVDPEARHDQVIVFQIITELRILDLNLADFRGAYVVRFAGFLPFANRFLAGRAESTFDRLKFSALLNVLRATAVL